MNGNNALSEIGYLVVRVTTALGAIPLENAAVTIRGNESSNETVIYSLSTNSDGHTERIALPTPPKSNSATPNSEKPYATYSVDVFADGYIPLHLSNVPVFSSIISIQPAIMIPLIEGENLRR